MEHVPIDYFYAEVNEDGESVLYGVEKVTGQVQGPPRMFTVARVNEYNYR